MSDYDEVEWINPDADMTPAEVDRHLKILRNELAKASLQLRRARDRELECEGLYLKARTKLLLSVDCPNVRGPGGVTVDERDAWLDNQLDNELWIYKEAKVARENAETYMRAVNKQVACIQSLGANARQAYGMAGRTE